MLAFFSFKTIIVASHNKKIKHEFHIKYCSPDGLNYECVVDFISGFSCLLFILHGKCCKVL